MADLKLPNINKFQVSGRITKDLELKHTPAGTAVISFGLANDRSYKDKDGNWQKSTEFFNIQAWSGTAELIAKSCKKGMAILIEGRIASRTYEKDGVEHRIQEVIAEQVYPLEWLPKDGNEPTQQEMPAPPPGSDDVPF